MDQFVPQQSLPSTPSASPQPVFVNGPVEPKQNSVPVARSVITLPVDGVNARDNGYSSSPPMWTTLPPSQGMSGLNTSPVQASTLTQPVGGQLQPTIQTPLVPSANSSGISNPPNTNVSSSPSTWIKAEEKAIALPADKLTWRDNTALASAIEWVFAPIPVGSLIFGKRVYSDELFVFHKRQSFVFGVVNLLAYIPLLLLFIPIISMWVAAFIWIPLSIFLFARFYYTYSAYQGERPIIPLISTFEKWIQWKQSTMSDSAPGSVSTPKG